MLNRKLRRDLQYSWRMLLAVTAIIAVGIACFIGMMSSSRNLEAAKSQYYSSCRMADFWIDLKKAPVEEVRRRARVDGLSEIRDRLQFKVIANLPEVDEPVSALMLSLPGDGAPVLNDIVMRRGSSFTNDRVNEVIVAEKFAKARGIDPGDRLEIVMNERSEELIVVGTAISAEFVYLTSPGSLVDDPKNFGLFWAKRSFLEDAFGFVGACNSVTGRFTPEARVSGAGTVLDTYSGRLEEFGVFVAIRRAQQFSNMTLSAEMSQLGKMALIFPTFFLFVGGLVLNVLMGRIAEQQRTVLGTFKALGYSDRELLRHYLLFGLVAGMLGALTGGVMGYWMAGAMTGGYLKFFSFPELVNGFYPGLILIGALMSMLACGLGTLQGVRRIVRLQPAEAMRPARPGHGGRILLERWGGLWSALDIQWQMVLRGLFRRKWRAAVSVISASLGAAIVILAFGFVNSLDAMIRIQFDHILRSDFHLTFSKELDRAVGEEIRRLPGITAAESVFMVPCTFEAGHRAKKGGVIGISPQSQLTSPAGIDGRVVPIPSSGLLMAQRLMDQLGLRPGDQLRLIPVKGHREPVTVRVAQGFPSMLGLDVYANEVWLNRLMGESASVSEVRVLARQNRDERRVFMRTLKGMPNLDSVTDIREQKQALRKQFDGAMRSTAVIMILLAAVIFFGSILNSTLIAMAEREREIATFSALGYFDRETARLFFRDNMVTNVAGTLIGLPMGVFMLKAMMIGFQTDAYSIPAILHPGSYLYTLALAVIFVLVAQIAVYRRLDRIDRVRALNVQE